MSAVPLWWRVARFVPAIVGGVLVGAVVLVNFWFLDAAEDALEALEREPGLLQRLAAAEEQQASWQRAFAQVVEAKQAVVRRLEEAEERLRRRR